MMWWYQLYDNKSSTDTHITSKNDGDGDRSARSIQNLISVLSDTWVQEHDEDDWRANSDEPDTDVWLTEDQEQYIKNKQIYLDRYVNTYTNTNRGIRNDINKKLYLKIANKVQGSTATTIDRTKTFVWPISSPHILPTYLDPLSQGIDIENRIWREVMSIGHGVVKSIKGSTVIIVYEVWGVDIEVSYRSPGTITVKKNQTVTMGRNIYTHVPIETTVHIHTSIWWQSIFPPYLFDPSSVTFWSEKPKITEEIATKPKKQEAGGGGGEDEKGKNEEDEKNKESLTQIDLPSWDAISSYIDQLLQDNVFGDVEIKTHAKKYLLALNKNNTNKVNIQWIAAFMWFDFTEFTEGIYSIESKDQWEYKADNLPTLIKINKKKKAKNKKELNIYTQSAIGKYQMIWSFILEHGQWLWPNGSKLDICTYNKNISGLSDKQKVKHITGRSTHRKWLLNTEEWHQAQEEMMKRSIISTLNTISTHPKVVKQYASLSTQDLYVLLSIRHFCGIWFLQQCLDRLDDPKKFMKLLNDRHDRLGTSWKDYIEKFLRLYKPSQAKHTIKISKKSTSSWKVYYTAK